MTFKNRLNRLERETFCPTCGRLLKQGNHGGLPIDITTLTQDQKRALYDQLHKDLPTLICGLSLEEFKQLPTEEKARLLRGG